MRHPMSFVLCTMAATASCWLFSYVLFVSFVFLLFFVVGYCFLVLYWLNLGAETFVTKFILVLLFYSP